MSETAGQSSTAKLAGMVTVALSLTTAGYQYNKSELLEMQSGLRRQVNEQRADSAKVNLEKVRTEHTKLLKEIEQLKKERDDGDAASECSAQQRGTAGAIETRANCVKAVAAQEQATPPVPVVAKALPSVYLQVSKDDLKAISHARVIRSRLRAKGYAVPQLELLPKARMPTKTEIRHVYAEDTDAAIALREVLKDLDVGRIDDIQVTPPMKRFSGRVPANVMELWLTATP